MTLAQLTISNESDCLVDVSALSGLVEYAFGQLALHADCELGITLVDEERMTTLHEDWMNEPGPTDVLSFPMDELRSAPEGYEPVAGMLGDIVLCPQVAETQAIAAKHSTIDEIVMLTTHGLLHLLGFAGACAQHQQRAQQPEQARAQPEQAQRASGASVPRPDRRA